MVVVSDTSPISNLFRIGRLELLQLVYERVVVPEAVMRELLELEKRGIDLAPIKQAGWIEITPVKDLDMVVSFKQKMIDEGESEAIVLAIELQADYLLIDERLGRAVAESAGIKVVGLLGTLREAKRPGFIPVIKPIIDQMRTVARFRISETLYRLILTEAGEADN